MTHVEIPSKWDVIPIHNSDRTTFKECRRRWNWSSPSRTNLVPRAEYLGVDHNLWFGTGIHWALEQFYSPGLRRDPVEAWKTWFNVQWRGGIITSEMLPIAYDLNPKAIQPEHAGFQALEHVFVDGKIVGMKGVPLTFQVQGLMNILPDADHETFEDLLDLGIGMMEFYKGYAARYDGFEVVATEHTFSIPIWDFANDRILKAIDYRTDSPNYEKELEVHARGRMDLLYRKPNGKIGVLDNKTAGKRDEELEKLEDDEQISTYLFAAQVEAKYYGLEYAGEAMEGLIYNVLYKATPKPPTMVRGGLFSIDRQNESVTYDMLMEWITKNNIDTSTFTEKHKEYINWLQGLGDEQFVVRKFVTRSQNQLKNVGYRMYQEAVDMLNPDLQIYPNITNNWNCLRCAFKLPCRAIEGGMDSKDMIENYYTTNRDR